MNDTGTILLGHMANGSENLDIGMSKHPFTNHLLSSNFYSSFFQAHPLASGFRIIAGNTTVTMPSNIPARKDYFVVRELSDLFFFFNRV